MMLGMTQQKISEELGIAFQQVQKYEKGVNRITAGRLYQLAGLLGVEVSYFFDNAPDPGVRAKPGLQVSATEVSIVEFLNTREDLELNRAFHAIRDPAQRGAIVDLLRAKDSESRS